MLVWFVFAEFQESKQLPFPLLNFAVDDVTAFQINSFTEGLLFKKQGEGWTVQKTSTKLSQNIGQKQEDAPVIRADSVKVAQFLTRFDLMHLQEPVATNQDSAKTFQINPHSLHVIFYAKNGKVLEKVFVGKPGPGALSTYLKRSKSNSVFLVQEQLHPIMLQSLKDWSQKQSEKKNQS